MNLNNLVCRTCLGIISEGKLAHNIDEENGMIRNVRNIREMIMFCVPEMDIYISVSPIICEACLRLLVSVYNYKIRCLRVENAIRSYIVANNVMEGSCVNLNNVVRQQIVEALKQRNWPPEIIKEYVDKYLCAAKKSGDRPNVVPTEVFQTMSKKFNAPRNLGNANVMLLVPNAGELSPLLNTVVTSAAGNTPPPPPPYPYEATQGANSRPPTPQYLSVSKNLMPQRTESLSLSQQVMDVNRLLPSPPIAQGALPSLQPSVPLPTSSAPHVGEFQNAFLSSLQLVSTANGGREEAIFSKKKVRPVRSLNTKKAKLQLQTGSQNVIPARLDKGSTSSQRISKSPAAPDGGLSGPEARVLSPTTGLLRQSKEQEVAKETGLRSVRKSVGARDGKLDSDKEEIIILDDDTDMTIEKIVENERLIMNFEENINNVLVPSDASRAPKATEKVKTMFVKLPMLDKETLKRKLTPEAVIDEILSKRRKLVVKLSSRLPYLHKNRHIVVTVRRDRFYTCMFCMWTTIDSNVLRKHYLSHHKVCALCNFKTDRAGVMTQHINAMHPLDLQEALTRYEENKPNFHCFLCKFNGLSELDLRDHRLRIHVKCDWRGMYQCPYENCKREQAIADNVAKHIEKVHDKLIQSRCPLCNYATTAVHIIRKHLKTHSLKNMNCTMCKFAAKTAFSLKMHIKKHHPESENKNVSGMIYVDANKDDDDDTSYSDDYRVTLDSLQSRTPESRQSASTSNPLDSRNLDQYEFAMPSLSEMLCSQTFSEGPEKEDFSQFQKTLPPKPAKRVSVIINKKNKKPQENTAVDDSEDCMIIPEEIPIVDLSDDDDDDALSVTKDVNKDQEGTDVIEIDDHNDSDDCFVVSDDPPVGTESSTEKNSENIRDTTIERPPDDSETDTCSEMSLSGKKKSPQGAVSGSETETCSEPSVSEILSQKTSAKNAEDVLAKENEEAPGDKALGSENVVPDLPASENKDSEYQEVELSEASGDKNSPSAFSPDQSDTNTSETVKDKSASNIEEIKETSKKSDESTVKFARCDQINQKIEVLNKRFPKASKNKGLKNTDESQKELNISADKCPESVLIESSDEDSNSCTFVSDAKTQTNSDSINVESENNKEKAVSEVEQTRLPFETDASEASEGTSQVSQKKLEIDVTDKENTDATAKADKPYDSKEISENAEKKAVGDKISTEASSENLEGDQQSDQIGVNESEGTVPIEPIPDSDDNIVTSGSSKPSADGEKITTDLLHTDTEMELDSVENSESRIRTSDAETNSSDTSNTRSEIEVVNIENSESCQKPSDKGNNDSDILNTDSTMKDVDSSEDSNTSDLVRGENKVASDVFRDESSEKIESSSDQKDVDESNDTSSTTREIPVSDDNKMICNSELTEENIEVESNKENGKEELLENVFEVSDSEMRTVDNSERCQESSGKEENDLNVLNVGSQMEGIEDSENSKTSVDPEFENNGANQHIKDDSHRDMIKETLSDNLNSTSGTDPDTVESAQNSLLRVLEVTSSIAQDSCASKGSENSDPNPTIVANNSEHDQKIIDSEKEDSAKSTEEIDVASSDPKESENISENPTLGCDKPDPVQKSLHNKKEDSGQCIESEQCTSVNSPSCDTTVPGQTSEDGTI